MVAILKPGALASVNSFCSIAAVAVITGLVGVHFGANNLHKAQQAGWTAAFYSAALSELVGGVVALFPGLWADLFTDVQAVRAACRICLQIVGPFDAFFGPALCQYFAPLGTGRMLWPVIAFLARMVVIVIACVVLARSPTARAEPFFRLIAAGMAVQAVVVGATIRLDAWTLRTRGP